MSSSTYYTDITFSRSSYYADSIVDNESVCSEDSSSESYESSIEEYKISVEEYHASLLNAQSIFKNLRRKHKKLYQVLPILQPYLSVQDVFACGHVNQKFNMVVSKLLWEAPNFHKVSHIHDSLYMLNRFLSYLPTIRPETLAQIHRIDISNMEVSLYEHVNPDFFRLFVKYCHQGLATLNMANVQFFTHKSLPKTNEIWQLPQLTTLDLSHCDQVNDDMIVSIARGCRRLIHVRLDRLTRHKGKGLAALAAECDHLQSVSIRYNTALEDQALVALGKFRHIRLKELDITGCRRITPVGLEVLGKYAAHLTYLSLAQTSCRLEDLKKFVCISRRTQLLDISACKQLAKQQQALAEWIWQSEFHHLKHLAMDTATATAIVKISQTQLIDVLLHVRQVTRLTLANLPEHTPLSYLYELLMVFPNLEYITFKRAYFETDFMLGTYRTPSPEDEECITDVTLDRFNGDQAYVIASMIHEREDDIDCNPMNW